MRLAELAGAGRSLSLPLTLHVPGHELTLCQWLRILPNRRYVALAGWQGRKVLAKLLVGRRARRHYLRECRGAAAMASRGILAPALLAHGYERHVGGWLLFAFLEGAESLGASWLSVEGFPLLSADQEALLGEALEAIGSLHHRGLWQEDLHLDNLLCHEGKLFWVDCGSVRAGEADMPLGTDLALNNLAVFFAQLPGVFDPYIDRLLAYYQRGGGLGDLPVADLSRQVGVARRRRLHDFLRKVGRDCTAFIARRSLSRFEVIRRDECDALRPLLDDPDRFIEAGKIIKAGNSSTVAQVSIDGRRLVVKRYNIKGINHWLRRCWRPTRSWHSWREGHRLAFLGIATPPPLAMLEIRNFGLRGRSYLVSEWIEGEDILTRFAPYLNSSPPEEELVALEQLFAAIVRERISHGDFKGTNLIWHAGNWVLLDLDALRWHVNGQGFVRAYARDRARFLRNWPVKSPLHRLLDERIPRVPLLNQHRHNRLL